MNDPPRLIVGVDWATQEHEICALKPDGQLAGRKSVEHSGDGLADLVRWLEDLSGGCAELVQVAIEVPHGAVVETLLERQFQVFSINPKQLDRFRDRHSLAGAKDDRRDARVLADSLRTDLKCFRRLRVEDPNVVELREWSRIDEEIKRERVRLTNQIRDQLRRYFPQALEVTPDVGERWFLELLKKISTPEQARKSAARSVAPILKRHRIRRTNATEILRTLHKRPVTVAPGTVEAASAHVRLLVDRVEVVNSQIRQCEQKLDALLDRLAEPSEVEDGESEKQRDVEILRSLPGVGRIVAATLLGEAPQAVRGREHHKLRALAGVAPVTIRSGKSRRVVMRRACHPRLRFACYHWARVAMQRDPVSREKYRGQRERGKSHGQSLRAVADRLLMVACSMLRHGTLYDPLRAHAKAG